MSLIVTLRAELATLLEQRATHVATRDTIIAAVEARNETTLTPEETTQVTEARAAVTGIDVKVGALNERIAELVDEETRDAAAATLRATLPGYDNQARVTGEALTYSADTSRSGVSYFADSYARSSGMADSRVNERMERYARENEVEKRATSTTSFAGLIVPQYLVDEAALVLRNGRPFANIVQGLPLPDQGTTFQVPRGTTGAATAVQATENSSVQSTDEVWANVTVPVITIAGQQDVSRQSLERGTPGLDMMVYLDIAGAYCANLDSQVISGTGAGGQMLGVLNTAGIGTATAFGAVVTAANFTLKVAGGVGAIAGAGTAIQPRIIAMHPRRWAWLQGQSDTQGRPLAVALPAGPYNAAGLIKAPGIYSADGPAVGETGAQIVGVLANGLPVITDANIPITIGTNSEDVVLIIDSRQLLLWEEDGGMPKQLRFEQTLGNQLTVKMVCYGYSAFTAGRYPAASYRVGGADTTATFGLVTPTF